MSLLTRIKNLAQEQSLSVSKLEELSCLGNGTIRRWDTSPPACDKLLRVANALNSTVDYLLTGNDIQNVRELSKEENDLLAEYKKLDFHGRFAVMQAVLAEQDRMENEKNTSGNTKIG